MTTKNIVEETNKDLPKYEVPSVITYTDADILEELGPAQANQYDIGDGVMGER
jgi:hypothetical protein